MLESLPSNGVPSNVSTIETLEDPDEIDSHDTDTILTGADADYEKENSSFLPLSTNDHLESDAIKNSLDCSKVDWPSVDSEPLNEYTTGFLATFAFPTLFLMVRVIQQIHVCKETFLLEILFNVF